MTKEHCIPQKPCPFFANNAWCGIINPILIYPTQLFEERPVWSRNSLCSQMQYPRDTLKLLLPTVAYYWLTGPWRTMWTKFGYDPRKDPASKVYQTLDYRIRMGATGQSHWLKASQGSRSGQVRSGVCWVGTKVKIQMVVEFFYRS